MHAMVVDQLIDDYDVVAPRSLLVHCSTACGKSVTSGRTWKLAGPSELFAQRRQRRSMRRCRLGGLSSE